MASHHTNIEFAKKKHYLVVLMPEEVSEDLPVIKGCFSYKTTAEAKSHGLLVITRKQWREQYPSFANVLNEFEAKELQDSTNQNLGVVAQPVAETIKLPGTGPAASSRTDLVISIDLLSDFTFSILGVSAVPHAGDAFDCHWESFISNEYILKFLRDFSSLSGNYFEVHDVGYTYLPDRCEVDFTIIKGN